MSTFQGPQRTSVRLVDFANLGTYKATPRRGETSTNPNRNFSLFLQFSEERHTGSCFVFYEFATKKKLFLTINVTLCFKQPAANELFGRIHERFIVKTPHENFRKTDTVTWSSNQSVLLIKRNKRP